MSEAYRKCREGQERAGREQAAVGVRHVEETKGSGKKVHSDRQGEIFNRHKKCERFKKDISYDGSEMGFSF